jgi:hypothetical protein
MIYIKRLILSITIAIAPISLAYAQQPMPSQEAPPPDTTQILANQIGMLVIQNASLNQQLQMQQQQIYRLRKQLADAKAPAPAPQPSDEK